MKYVIADTNIWIGAFVTKDKWHKNGKRFLEWLEKQQNVRVIVPIGIIYEVIAGILNKPYGRYRKAKIALDLFMNHKKLEIYYNTEQIFEKVMKIFEQYTVFSLVDSTIIFLYLNKKCSFLLSTDGDYDQCGPLVTRLEIPF